MIRCMLSATSYKNDVFYDLKFETLRVKIKITPNFEDVCSKLVIKYYSFERKNDVVLSLVAT